MNSATHPDNPQIPPKKPNFDKTIIEGIDAKTGYHTFDTKVRLDATKVGATSPYGNAPKKTSYVAGELPTGNEPIPLGSGTVVGLLGSGGMARVYKIWNEKLEVFRAVKILIPTQQGDLKNRFETEAKITAKLRHPNIVEIYSVGDWNGLPFLEMELIDGASLENMIGRIGKLPPSVCSSIAIFVARALTYAHNQEFLLYGKNYHGIIHRDLKPANIMISKHGDLRLMDFGIARPTEASLHTVEGNIVGTMQYLSPEQLDGVDVDSRADVYSFGAILYEMVTGTKTFPQNTITNLMKKKITNEYRKFDDFDFTVPQGLAKAASKCLQIDKEKRYPNAADLLAELENIHASLSSDDPETVLKSYLENPSSISSKVKSSGPGLLKIVLPACAVAIVGILITVFMLTGPKSDEPIKPVKPVAQVQQQKPQVAQPVDPSSLRPLSSEPQTQSVETGPEFNEPSVLTQQTVRTPPQQTRVKPEPRFSGQSVATRNPRPQPDQEKEPSSSESPFEKLKKKYGSTDAIEIGQKALAKNAYDDAVEALVNVPSSSSQHEKAFLLTVDALIQSDKLRTAKEMILNEQINDAQYCLLTGVMYQRMGRAKDALENFQTALTKPSNFRSIFDVRNDALYFTAVTYNEMYKDDPSLDNRGLAMQGWRVVKNMYSSNPDNARYKKAVSELGNIK
jgi:serine/threonine protein kinase